MSTKLDVELSGMEPATSPGGHSTPATSGGLQLPCRTHAADLWFAEHPADLQRAKDLCGCCAARASCLEGALQRSEPWGVWGGEILAEGVIVARKRPRGRPPRDRSPVTAPTNSTIVAA